MDPNGEWHLTPAYDVTFARGEGWTRVHQLRVRGKTSEIREMDLLAIASEFGVKKPGRMIDRARNAIADWEVFAAAYDVPRHDIAAIRSELDRRDSELRS